VQGGVPLGIAPAVSYRADFLVPFFADLVAFVRAGAFLPDDFVTLPTTATAPGPGMTVDSSPVDHLIRSSCPMTPVTTPSRGAWPTFVDSNQLIDAAPEVRWPLLDPVGGPDEPDPDLTPPCEEDGTGPLD
jgi:hypothetical protein